MRSVKWNGVKSTSKRAFGVSAARAKNARQNDIPAIRLAVDILKSLPRFGDRFVFTTTGDRVPVSGFNKAKLQFDGTIEELRRAEAGGKEPEPIKPWVFHDLRRTAATNLQRLGVWLEVTEAILNHVSGSRAGIVGVYQKHDYAAEKREALDAWATPTQRDRRGERAMKTLRDIRRVGPANPRDAGRGSGEQRRAAVRSDHDRRNRR